MRDELRGLRFSMEYYKADLLMREWGVRSTVVVFGSARIPAPEAVEALLAAAPPARRGSVPSGRPGSRSGTSGRAPSPGWSRCAAAP